MIIFGPGGRGRFPVRPGGPIRGPIFHGDFDDDDYYPSPPVRRPARPIWIPLNERDTPQPDSWPHPPTTDIQPVHYPRPPPGRRDHRQSQKFTPWILNLTSETHKCADLNLFKAPKPQPRSPDVERTARRPGTLSGQILPTQRNQNPCRRGSVVLPILPGPKRRLPFFDVSVMTISNVLYTPGARYSELSWKLLQGQGFTRHSLHHDHMHNITHRGEDANQLQYPDGADRLRAGGGLLTINEDPNRPPRPGRNMRGGRRFPGGHYEDECRSLDKESSVIRHPSLPNVDLLWCMYDRLMNPGTISVHFTAASMVDLNAWSWSVEKGVVGRSSGWRGSRDSEANTGVQVGWLARYGGRSPSAEPEPGDAEDLFRRIVQGGLYTGQDLAREMGVLSLADEPNGPQRDRDRRVSWR